jgi:excisionase family DNA binding protein
MQLPEPVNDVTVPAGFPVWLSTFISEAVAENQTLIENGAAHAAAARRALLNKLISAAQQYLDGELTVAEAASLLGKHPETIRRAVRNGAIPDSRATPRGHLRIRRGDLATLAGDQADRYDPVADAQDIAQRRRPR